MHKTIKNSTNPHGFTLIELVLVMAILLILLSVVYATLYIVSSSHAQVVVINDAKDYAYLNMAAIEKSIVNSNDIIILSDTSVVPGYTSLYFNNGDLMSSASTDPVFSYPQYTVSTASGTKPKWDVHAVYSWNSDGTLIVNLGIWDNATDKRYYTLEKDIILLNKPNISGSTGSSVVEYK